MERLEEARKRLEEARRVAVLTGAGISKPSGIPTFRDAEGLWKNFNPLDYATPEAYARDPEKVWAWYAWRIQKVREAKPNPAHYALVELERRILSRGEASSSSPRTWTAFTPSREARTWWSSTATSSGPGARPAGSGFPCRRPSPRPLLPGLRPPGPARCGLVRGVSAGRGLGEGGKGLRRGRLRLGGGHQRRGGARGLLGPDRLRLGGLPGGGEPRAHPHPLAHLSLRTGAVEGMALLLPPSPEDQAEGHLS